jgi:hypothetical protein
MGGFVFDTSTEGPILFDNTRAMVTPAGVMFLMKHDPGLIPDISEDEIRDKSKADSIAKVLLVWQLVYFCLSCVSRLAQRLPLSLLEVTTFAHALCTMITYMMWWKKPRDINLPTVLIGQKANDLSASEVAAFLLIASKSAHDVSPRTRELAKAAESRYAVSVDELSAACEDYVLPNSGLGETKFRDDTPGLPEFWLVVVPSMVLFLVPFIYGLSHLLAWSGDFVTPTERTLWRVASFCVAFSRLALMVADAISSLLARILSKKIGDNLGSLTNGISLVVYPVCSGYLLAESIRQLFALPEGAFEVASWSKYWPHFS